MQNTYENNVKKKKKKGRQKHDNKRQHTRIQ